MVKCFQKGRDIDGSVYMTAIFYRQKSNFVERRVQNFKSISQKLRDWFAYI